MPHDVDGHILTEGDIVYVPCIIKKLQKGTDYCNVDLETEYPMFPSANVSTFTLNSKQVVKAQSLKDYAT